MLCINKRLYWTQRRHRIYSDQFAVLGVFNPQPIHFFRHSHAV